LATGNYDQDAIHSLKKKSYRKLREESDWRIALLKKDYYVYEMWSCFWHNEMVNNQRDHPIAFDLHHMPKGGPNPLKPKLTEQEIIQFILSDKLHGFIRAKIEVPEEMRDDNKMTNWPPILERRKVKSTDLDPNSQDYADWHCLMSTTREPVVQGYTTENRVVLTTLMVKYLLEMGCTLSEIDVVIQYRFSKLFKEFRNWCERGRQYAAKNGKKILDAFLKAIGK